MDSKSKYFLNLICKKLKKDVKVSIEYFWWNNPSNNEKILLSKNVIFHGFGKNKKILSEFVGGKIKLMLELKRMVENVN